MDTLIVIIISGMAVSYVVEFVSSLVDKLIPPRIIKMLLTLPLGILATWLLGLYGNMVFVAGTAAAFFSLVVLHLLNRNDNVDVQQLMRRR